MKSVKRSGFTILEVLIASLLVGVGMFSLMEAFNRGVFGVGEIEDYTLALSLTQEKLEEIQYTGYSVASETKADVSGFTEFEQEVTVTTPNTNLKQVVVTTYWDTADGENSVSATSYVANI